MSRKVLEGIRVIDWGQWNQGPEGSALLGDLGADVIHVEQLGIGDQHRGIINIQGVEAALPQGRHATFEYYNRNKRGIAVDLKNPAGREIMRRLVERCDVFVTNFLPSVARKLGLDYATLSELNPKLIYGSASIYGERGPQNEMPGFDQSVVARSGLLMNSGDASLDGPCWLPVGLADQMGGMALGFGLLAAITARERFGIGQEVNSSAFGAFIKLMSYDVILSLLAGKSLPRMAAGFVPPTNRCYRCQDGEWIQLSCHREVDWGPLCRAIGIPEAERDPELSDIVKRTQSARLIEKMEQTFATRPRREWLEMLSEARVPHSAVNKVDQLKTDQMAIANDYVFDYDHPALGKVKFIGFPWHLSETPAEMSRPAPECGEHTEEILIEWAGYTWDEITELRKKKAI